VGHAAAFAVHRALVLSYGSTVRVHFPCTTHYNAKQEAGQAASTIFKVFGNT